MGSLYRRGKIWWLQVYQAGRAVRESTGASDKAEARRLLRERERQIDAGERPTTTKAPWESAADDLRAYYKAYGTRNLREAGHRLAHLDRYCQGMKWADINTAAFTGYVVKRKGMGKASGSINIELATLKRALRLAYEHGKLAKVPVIRMLKPNAPRSGFFELDQFRAVSAALPADLARVVSIGYTFGWRLKSEVLTLSKRQVDLEAGTIRLAPGSTKNGEGRIVYLTAELRASIAEQLVRVKAMERQTGRITPWLFPHLGGNYRGQRRKNFVTTWQRACQRAGCEGMLRHDLRRAAVRNMLNAGVPERVAMKVTGHRTISAFHRHHIVSPGDLQAVAIRLQNRHNPQTQWME